MDPVNAVNALVQIVGLVAEVRAAGKLQEDEARKLNDYLQAEIEHKLQMITEMHRGL